MSNSRLKTNPQPIVAPTTTNSSPSTKSTLISGLIVLPGSVTLPYGLVAFGQITLRRITGHQHVASIDQVIENAA